MAKQLTVKRLCPVCERLCPVRMYVNICLAEHSSESSEEFSTFKVTLDLFPSADYLPCTVALFLYISHCTAVTYIID